MATKTSTKPAAKKTAPVKTAKTTKTNKPAYKPSTKPAKGHAVPEDYAPLTMWGIFGYQFLFNIPVAGWIVCFAFAFMTNNHNLRNLARAQALWIIIGLATFCTLCWTGALSTILKAFGVI